MHTFPKPLTPGEERSCLERMKEGDHEARNTLIERNLRLVAHVTRKYQGTDYEMEWNVTLVLPDLYMDLLCDLVFWYCLVRVIGIGTPGQDPMMIGRIAMIGIALFQILWECNSRYVITFLPMMILMALDGYFTCKQRLTQAD